MSTARTWKLSLLLCNGGQKWPFFSFFYLLENWLKYIFFSCPPEKFYDIWAQLTKISSKSEKLLLNKILLRFRQIGKWKFSTTSLIKSWSYEFSSLIDLKGIKKFIIASAKNFWPWRPGRLQSGREHFTWFWLYYRICPLWFLIRRQSQPDIFFIVNE